MKRWAVIKNFDDSKANQLANELHVEPVIAKLLLQRNVNTFEESRDFFRPTLDQLHNPFLMKDMDKAVERINHAIANNQKVLVYGDYDVDGTTSVALVYSFLKKQLKNSEHIDFYIPDRYLEGYGISFQGIDFAAENNFSLIIALDCGIKSIDKIDYANAKGVDFIICDHHRPGDEIPKAYAVLDAKREDCNYPFKELTGCGVGFKLLQGWCIHNKISTDTLFNSLDLVAISTAADIVPINGENRILSYYGLQEINLNSRPAVKAILQLTNIKRELTISDIVFVIGPRINAAGRIDKAKKAVEFLISESMPEAEILGEGLQKTNSDRQNLDKTITSEALQMIIDKGWEKRMSTVLFNSDWHKGVIGIVASRLTDKYYRPTIMLTESNGMVTGSARSVKNFDVYEAIELCSDLLIQFGGHKYAAGLTLKRESVESFVDKFEEVVRVRMNPDWLIPEIEIDAELTLEELTFKLLRIIKQFAPFGPENMAPVFASYNLTVADNPRVVGESHLKFDVYDEKNPQVKFAAIAFNQAQHHDLINSTQKIDLAYAIEENEWNGTKMIQLNVKDIRPHTK